MSLNQSYKSSTGPDSAPFSLSASASFRRPSSRGPKATESKKKAISVLVASHEFFPEDAYPLDYRPTAELTEKELLALFSKEEGQLSAPEVLESEETPKEFESIYGALKRFGILTKLVGMSLAKANVPWDLRRDAEQEIYAHWCSLEAKPGFKEGQIAYYAYKAGEHAALRLRRSLEAVVVIPGSAFKAGKDTLFMGSIGAALNPFDVTEMQDDSEMASHDLNPAMRLVTESYVNARLAPITLSRVQRTICLKVMVDKMDPIDVAEELNLEPNDVERLMNQVSNRLIRHDKEVREGKKCSGKSLPLASRADLKKGS